MEKSKFLNLFKEEAKERVNRVLALLGSGNVRENLKEIMREAHTLKGASRMVGLNKLSDFSHKVEEFISKVEAGKINLDDETVKKVLEKSFNYILKAATQGEDKIKEGEEFLERALRGEIKASDFEGGITVISEDRSGGSETIRVETDKVDRVMNLAEEVYMKAKNISKKELPKKVEGELQELERELGELHSSISTMRLTPLKGLLSSFSVEIGELAEKLGKEVRFIIEGADVKLDERIIEEIREPLIHLLRNAVDHGIEPPSIRERKVKDPVGTIKVKALHMGEMVRIEVSDDGGGIDIEKIRKKAVQLGLIGKDEDVPESTLLNMIFHPKFSTRDTVNEISGRGYGMDIVKNRVEEVGGRVIVETEKDKGTKVILLLPTTLTLQKVLLFTIDTGLYGLRSEHLSKIYRYRDDEIKRVEGKGFFMGSGHPIELRDMRSKGNGGRIIVTKDQTLAVAVDQVLNEIEALIRQPKGRLRKIPFLSGYTLYEEKIIPILNVFNLKESGVFALKIERVEITKKTEEKQEEKTILLAEDSPLARELIKSMLINHNFNVLEAKDGVEALKILESHKVDLIVTDIGMPRLDGFSLIERVRASKYRDLPIVVVTSKGSEEEIRRGMMVGADAYLVKGKFTERELVQKIGELLNE